MKSYFLLVWETLYLSILIENHAEQSISVADLFITLNISCHSFLACKVSAEKSVNSLMLVPL